MSEEKSEKHEQENEASNENAIPEKSTNNSQQSKGKTIDENQSINKKMEVHHHPKVEKKNFQEYLLEFIMISLAVTLGFFAEGLREDISNHHREKQYIQSMSSLLNYRLTDF